MGLLSSIFSRAKPAVDVAPEAEPSVDNVARARSRARQRLLGAVVLVGIGIIGFPLLFETQPRPIPVDVPIEIPAREGAAPLRQPDQRASGTGNPAPAQSSGTVITETAAEAGLTSEKSASVEAPDAGKSTRSSEPVPERPAPAVVERDRTAEKTREPRPEEKPAALSVAKVEPVPKKAAAAEAAADREEAARARALLEGKVAPKQAASSSRYIVQIGAFADPELARATRQKVERLGLVTYTHVAKTPQGERTRVRVGPVASREEAEKMAAKIKAAGLPTAILTL